MISQGLIDTIVFTIVIPFSFVVSLGGGLLLLVWCTKKLDLGKEVQAVIDANEDNED